MSLHNAKLFSRSLAIASAALVMHIGTATAADVSGDVPQTRELLAGTTTAHSGPQFGPRDGKVANPTPDAQELARQLLAGTNRLRVASADSKPNAAGPAGEFQPQQHPVDYGDAQAAAQQMLLGQHPASRASATRETVPQKRPLDYGDAQAAAQQMLLGQHRVSVPSSRTARATR